MPILCLKKHLSKKSQNAAENIIFYDFFKIAFLGNYLAIMEKHEGINWVIIININDTIL